MKTYRIIYKPDPKMMIKHRHKDILKYFVTGHMTRRYGEEYYLEDLDYAIKINALRKERGLPPMQLPLTKDQEYQMNKERIMAELLKKDAPEKVVVSEELTKYQVGLLTRIKNLKTDLKTMMSQNSELAHTLKESHAKYKKLEQYVIDAEV